MHELGIVMHVVDEVEEAARENKVEKVLKLSLEIGEVSSVVPELFADCFEWAKKRTQYLKEAELNMIIIEGRSYCRDCKTTYRTTEFAKKCPNCSSEDTYLVTGNEVIIKDLEVV